MLNQNLVSYSYFDGFHRLLIRGCLFIVGGLYSYPKNDEYRLNDPFYLFDRLFRVCDVAVRMRTEPLPTSRLGRAKSETNRKLIAKFPKSQSGKSTYGQQ